MIHRSEFKNSAAGVLEDKGVVKPRWLHGPQAGGQLWGRTGKGKWEPSEEQAGEEAWSWAVARPGGSGVQTQAVGPSTANGGGNGKSK